jgi:hypothetical protein
VRGWRVGLGLVDATSKSSSVSLRKPSATASLTRARRYSPGPDYIADPCAHLEQPLRADDAVGRARFTASLTRTRCSPDLTASLTRTRSRRAVARVGLAAGRVGATRYSGAGGAGDEGQAEVLF